MVCWLSGCEQSGSGPAAGLTVIVSGAIAQVGSWPAFLAVTVIAGVIQTILGMLKGLVLAGHEGDRIRPRRAYEKTSLNIVNIIKITIRLSPLWRAS